MNYVDFNFNWLINEIKTKTKDEIYNHIKTKYLNLPVNIKDILEKFFKDYNYWGKLDYKKEIFEELYNKTNTFYEHLNDLIWLYNHLEDYRSKQLLFGILYNWYDYDFNILKNLCEDNFYHYFDLDIIKCHDEVFVDLGAYNGDTTLDFINSYGRNSYKRIYCYEMTNDSFKQLKKNLKEYRKNIEILFISIKQLAINVKLVILK